MVTSFSVPLAAIAAFSRDARVFRAFDHLLAADFGQVLCVPVRAVAGDLTGVVDGCPVPWEEVCAVLDTPPNSPVPLPGQALELEFPELGRITADLWRSDRIGIGPAPARSILRLTHDSGLRFALALPPLLKPCEVHS